MKSEKSEVPTKEQLLLENEGLKARLGEAEETIRAIQSGEVDAIIVEHDGKEQIYTLKGADETYRVLFEQMNEGAVTIAEDGGILYCNRSFASSMKSSLEKIIGSDFKRYLKPSDESTFKRLLERSVAEPIRGEVTLRASDGILVPMQLAITFLPTAKAATYCIVLADLSDRIRAEMALKKSHDELETRVQERTIELKESEEKYRGLFNNLQEAVSLFEYVLDEDGEVTDWRYLDINEATRKAIGKLSRDIVGKTVIQVFGSDTMAIYVPLVREMRTKNLPIMHEGYFEPVDAYSLNFFAPLNEEMFIVSTLDITGIKKAEEKLTRSNEELRHFAYISSHDLQEPLRMVSSYLGLLERRHGNELSDEAKEFMSFAVEGATRMRGLINDLLSYTRVDSGGKPFVRVDMNLALAEARENLNYWIEANHAAVTSDRLPTIMADDSQMMQLFQNLISNAIKFHDSKVPRVRVSCKENWKEWIFSVQDNGIGIPTQYQDKIFEMFQRLHTREEYEGTGIGLAIAKRIVERHDGRIWVESDGKSGSTFFFTIPKARR